MRLAFSSFVTLCLCAATAVMSFVDTSYAADWPTYRFDARRSANSPEQLPAELHVQWVLKLGPLEPAWPDQPRMRFDVG